MRHIHLHTTFVQLPKSHPGADPELIGFEKVETISEPSTLLPSGEAASKSARIHDRRSSYTLVPKGKAYEYADTNNGLQEFQLEDGPLYVTAAMNNAEIELSSDGGGLIFKL